MNPQQSKVAFLTVVYPAMRDFLDDFLMSLERQSTSDFDLVVFNDGLHDFDFIRCGLNVRVVDVAGTPASIREQGLRWLADNGYEFVICGDSDDYFDDRRVEGVLKLLGQYDLVVNDVSLVDRHGNMLIENYFANRIGHLEEVDLAFVADRNVFGLSNTAARLSAWETIQCPEQLVAADWYLFSRALMNGAKAVFNKENVTYYRQHDANTVGLKELTPEKILADLRCKVLHYEALSDVDSRFGTQGASFRVLYDGMVRDNKKLQDYYEYINERRIEFPFWWEEIVLPEE